MTEISEVLKIGDVVQLKSSGPWMTIESIYLGQSRTADEGYAKCQWFVNDSLQSGLFYVTSLRIRPIVTTAI